MSRPKIPKKRIEDEGRFLKALFSQRQAENLAITQEWLAGEMSCTQGLIHQWLNGKTNIPDQKLIKLGAILGFNAFTLRPELEGMIMNYLSKDSKMVAAMVETLSDQDRRQALAYVQGLAEGSKDT